VPKVTYERLRFEKFFWGLYPGPSLKRGEGERGPEEGKEGWGEEGEAGKGRR
jgi:hypothetical protein